MPDLRPPQAVSHDRNAPFWAVALVLLVAAGLSTTVLDRGELWSGYVLDATGPAWAYILVRLRFTEWVDNGWTRLFTPGRSALLCAGTCWGIELLQYLEVYDATFDPWDLVAYLAILLPLHLADRFQLQRAADASLSRGEAT